MTISSDTQADYLLDRRRLRRKVTFWRVAAFVALAAVVLVGAWRFGGLMNSSRYKPHIARVAIEGLITGDRASLKVLDDVAKSNASAVILSIDSPGGTTTGAERLYDAIRRVEAKKPVVAVVGTMAASGAYIAALGADRIVAQGNSLVGSIGVLFQFPNVSKLLDTVGVHMEEVKSSPLKAAPNGMEPTSPEARAALAALVSDSFDWFKGLVKDRRAMSDAELAAIDDGRVFTGRQSVGLKLIDATGSERDAIHWLETQKGVAANLPIRDWRPERNLGRLGIFGVSAGIASFLGLDGAANLLRHIDTTENARVLDGMLAVWQGGVVN